MNKDIYREINEMQMVSRLRRMRTLVNDLEEELEDEENFNYTDIVVFKEDMDRYLEGLIEIAKNIKNMDN